MTGEELVTRVNEEIENPQESKFSNAEILSLVNEGYNDFCRVTEILERLTTKTTSAYEAGVDLPSDYVDARAIRWSFNRELYPRTERQFDYQQSGWQKSVGIPESVTWINYNRLRLQPIPSAAGTVMFRYIHSPTALTLTTEPEFPPVYHVVLADFAASEAFWIMREYENANRVWVRYLNGRNRAKSAAALGQTSPDTFISQRPVTVFNYKRWDYGYRSR